MAWRMAKVPIRGWDILKDLSSRCQEMGTGCTHICTYLELASDEAWLELEM